MEDNPPQQRPYAHNGRQHRPDETSIALHAISGELLENVFYPMTYRPPIRRTEYRVANPERIQAFLSATNRVSIPLGSVDYVED